MIAELLADIRHGGKAGLDHHQHEKQLETAFRIRDERGESPLDGFQRQQSLHRLGGREDRGEGSDRRIPLEEVPRTVLFVIANVDDDRSLADFC